MTPEPPSVPSPDETKRAFVACGLDRGEVSVEFDPLLQAEIVRVESAPVPWTDALLACIGRAALDTNHHVQFRSEATQRRYGAVRHRLESQHAIGGEAVAARAQPPRRHACAAAGPPCVGLCKGGGTPLRDRAGNAAGRPRNGYDHLGRQRDPSLENPAQATDDQFTCILNVLTAAGLESRELFFGFIGNEAEPPR